MNILEDVANTILRLTQRLVGLEKRVEELEEFKRKIEGFRDGKPKTSD